MGKKETIIEKMHRLYMKSLRASISNKRIKLDKLEKKIIALELKLKKHGGWYG